MRRFIGLILCVAIFTVAGCKRKTHDYAGVTSDNNPPYSVTADPNSSPAK